MIKKFFTFMMAAGVLLATSCSHDDLDTVQSGNETQVTFSLSLERKSQPVPSATVHKPTNWYMPCLMKTETGFLPSKRLKEQTLPFPSQRP